MNFSPASYKQTNDMNPISLAAQSQFNGRLFFTENFNTKPPCNEDDRSNFCISLNERDRGISYEMYDGANKKQNISTNTIDHIVNPTAVASAYFNNKNRDYIQLKIIEKISDISSGQYKIGRQSDEQLNIIMRSIYLQYGKNLPTNIDMQVEELDNMVINECVRIIVPNIQQHVGFINDISSPTSVMPLPKNTIERGNKLIDTTKTFWNFDSF
jgi:hypothetical protein